MNLKELGGLSKGTMMRNILDELATIIASRRAEDPMTSYVASLNSKGLNKILEKVGEEAIEVLLAAKEAEGADKPSEHVVNEVADLIFHTLVMLDRLGISHNAVLDVLASRQGISGLDEKASRNKSSRAD